MHNRDGLIFREADAASQAREVHILHVEDDAFVAAAVRETLGGEGWRVSTCADGRSALREIEGGARYDLLIVDNELPGVDGLELLCHARALPHRRQTPLLMLSASGVEREARRAGASAFLRKPEDVSALVETVAHLLAHAPEQA